MTTDFSLAWAGASMVQSGVTRRVNVTPKNNKNNRLSTYYHVTNAMDKALFRSAVLVSTVTLFAATAHAEVSDPTAGIIPTIECDSPTCMDAASAFSRNEYVEAAQLFTHYFEQLPADDDSAGVWLVQAAFAHHRAEDWDEAARLYRQAADKLTSLQDYLLTQAVRTSLEGDGDDEIFEKALQSDALGAGYEDGYLLKARVQSRLRGSLDHQAIESALTHNDIESVCPWLLARLVENAEDESVAPLLDLAHAHCVDRDLDDAFGQLSFDPAATARLHRALRLFRAVRFPDALAQLDAIEDGSLSEVDQCKADFRRARSHFRLRQYQSAEDIYREIVDRCTDEANEDERVRSLYAVGNRLYHRAAGNAAHRSERLDESERYFTRLFEEYPYRSHADDALFFLARIERQRDEADRDREKELLVQALEKYPHEDMIHEMAWEVFEPLFRGGEYRQFIDGVTALPLPDWDHQYFSQGRLEYFVGLAHARLDDIDSAERYWQLAWVKYPFSFYGYTAHLRLVENQRQPEPLRQVERATSVDWFDESFQGTGGDILARVGHLEGACDFESARLSSMDATRSDRWRLAALCHEAGRYPVSHNIARRQISGRPWSVPLDGRLVRWHVAWPDPFGAQLASAVAEFGPQEHNRRIHPGLPSAIMREESAFIEDVVSWAGAIGLMQLMPATARDHDDVIDGIASPDRLKSAEVNIPVGIDHIAALSRRFEGHPVLITAAYNAGGGRIDGWLRRQPEDEIALWVENIPFLETRNYTKRVIGSYAAYQFLRGETELDDRILLPAR